MVTQRVPYHSRERFLWIILSVIATAVMGVTFVSLIYKYHGGFSMFEFVFGVGVGGIISYSVVTNKQFWVRLLAQLKGLGK